MADEKVIDKVRKLLALAEKAGTEEEAASAFAKAQELMAKHAIEMDMVAEKTGQAFEQIIGVKVGIRDRDETGKAKRYLLGALARANRCQAIVYSGANATTVFGHESDAQFVEMLYTSVLLQMELERSKAWRAYAAETPKGMQTSRFRFVNNFCWAYAGRVGARLTAAAERNQPAKQPGTELAIRDRSLAVQDWIGQNLGKLGTSRTRGSYGHGSEQGRDAGDRADLSGGRNNLGGQRRALS